MRTACKTFAVLLLCLLLGGCTLFSPVRDLLSSPAFSPGNEALRRAFESSFGTQVQYCAPISGAYLSAFVVDDFDGDDGEEALVFYLPDIFTSTVHIGVLDCEDGVWLRTAELEGGGSDVYSVERIDLDTDGSTEIVLCWSTPDNSRVMSIYACADAPFSLQRLSEQAYTEKLLADFNSDGRTEIFTLSLYSEAGSQTARARMSEKSGARIALLDQIELDGKVSGYAGVLMQKTDFGCVLYADAYKGEAQMITEVIRFDAASSSMTAPLLDAQTRTNERTWRSAAIRCRDIDGDGVPEIPCQRDTLPGAEALRGDTLRAYTVYLTQWCAFRGDDLVPVEDCLVHENLRWQFRIPDDLRARFTLRVDPDADTWSFIEFDPETSAHGTHLFSVAFTTRAQWVKERGSVYASYKLLRSEREDVLLLYEAQDSEMLSTLSDAFTYMQP